MTIPLYILNYHFQRKSKGYTFNQKENIYVLFVKGIGITSPAAISKFYLMQRNMIYNSTILRMKKVSMNLSLIP